MADLTVDKYGRISQIKLSILSINCLAGLPINRILFWIKLCNDSHFTNILCTHMMWGKIHLSNNLV